jgi:hypothetical protein
MASSQGAIRVAQESGATTVPQATLYLQLATEERQQALAMVGHDNHRASYLLARSEADADLALAIAREASAARTAEHANAQVEQLQEKAVAR